MYPILCKEEEPTKTCRMESLPLACPAAIQTFEDDYTTSKLGKTCKGGANGAKLKHYDPSKPSFKAMAFSSNFGGEDSPQRCLEEWYKFSQQIDKKTAKA